MLTSAHAPLDQAEEEADVLRRIIVRLILHDNILLQIGMYGGSMRLANVDMGGSPCVQTHNALMRVSSPHVADDARADDDSQRLVVHPNYNPE
jgi:hypothetical protein